ncbi:hypothetical protein TWF970_003021 [Orbilia oligospora]|uniref:Uncharacterized protein n=1 Tax=Orbilia oligospora TaxID=2813651 RepID=A0A7C8V7B3_ORBOL|nr:hypothetical protein TWF970_003021 [Orbilia oligospora]
MLVREPNKDMSGSGRRVEPGNVFGNHLVEPRIRATSNDAKNSNLTSSSFDLHTHTHLHQLTLSQPPNVSGFQPNQHCHARARALHIRMKGPSFLELIDERHQQVDQGQSKALLIHS